MHGVVYVHLVVTALWNERFLANVNLLATCKLNSSRLVRKKKKRRETERNRPKVGLHMELT